MTSWPTVATAPIELPVLAGHDQLLWTALLELAELRSGEWTLIGGQMVLLHALEQASFPRESRRISMRS